MADVTVVDHPLVQHKLSIMRRKDTPTAKFRQLLNEISLLLGYEVTRDFAIEMRTITTPLTEMPAPFLSWEKARADLDTARGQRSARRNAQSRALRPGRPYRALS